ncbi:MAG: type II toxin-antitoxin system HicB family antitoxin [Deltaproteobacteria bacterium]|nr:type II toxin-antitoxin system HicB family antitoxin [Deltaproteobacteria bacterium]
MPNISMEISLPVKIEKKDKWLIASCPILDVFTQGKTKEEAKNNLNEALTVFLISCCERGVLEAALKQRGIECYSSPIEADTKATKQINREDYINIPLHLLSPDSKSLKHCLA